MRFFIACFLVAAFAAIPDVGLAQQAQTVTGTVTSDEDGSGLPGVTVLEKGTNNGTVTNVDGVYSIAVSEGATLVFNSIGFLAQEVAVGGRSVVDVVLITDVKALEEVVIVGYGTQKKKDLTGSITSVTGDDINQVSSATFDQMLQGKVPGVQISQTTGAPGGNVNVLIRGISSITGGNQPLYVVDGYPIGTGGGGSDMRIGSATMSASGMANMTQNRVNPLASINPADIESVEILKDASATAIYGSRGANGVIIITTKRGKRGESQLNFNASYGVQEVANKLDMMNSQQYAQYVAEGRDHARVFAGGAMDDPNEIRGAAHRVRPEFRNPSSITVNTDWQDVIFRTAPVQNYQLSASSSTDKMRMYFAGNYFNQQGVILTSDYQRFTLRSNIDADISDKLTIGSSISGSYGYGRFPLTEGHYGEGGVLMNALSAGPTIPVYDDQGNPYFNQADVTDGLGFLANVLAVLDGYSDNRKVADVLINNYVEYQITEGLSLRSTLGATYNTNTIKLWRSSAVPFFTTLNYPATAGVSKFSTINYLNENTLSYKRLIQERHSFDVLAGFTSQKNSTDRISAGASDFPSEYVPYISAGIVNTGTHTISEWSMLSLMGRVNYSFDGKYLFTATVRRDGSSRFGQNNRWGTFPSFSVGYNVSDEPFMETVDFINNLKFRASYGIAGNNAIGNYTHIGLLGSSTYVDGNQRIPGVVPSSLSNYDLTWERSKQTNIGVDLSLFNDRISLTADVYRDLKTDLLLAVGLPAASGFTSSVQNIGNIENKGVELGLQTVNVRAGRFEWSSALTLSANKNEVLALATEGERIFNSPVHITEEGHPIGSFYLLNQIGVFKNQEELAGAPVQHPRTGPGDPRFEDVDGNGVINLDDRKILGDPWPDYTWGLENRFTFGDLTLRVFLNGQQGSYSYFQAGTTILNMAGVQNQLLLSENRWRSENDPGNGMVPRAIRSNHALAFSPENGRFLFNSSFTRIRNVNLSYNLPESLSSRMSLKGLSVFIDILNLHTWTDYPGYDPESSTSGDNVAVAGYDAMSYPLPRTYTFGIQLTL